MLCYDRYIVQQTKRASDSSRDLVAINNDIDRNINTTLTTFTPINSANTSINSTNSPADIYNSSSTANNSNNTTPSTTTANTPATIIYPTTLTTTTEITNHSPFLVVLCSPFHERFYFWQALLLTHLVSMSFARSFLSASAAGVTQSFVFLTFSLAALITHTYFRPFAHRSVNAFQSFALLCVSVYVMVCMPNATLRSSDVATDRLPSSVENGLCFTCCIYMLVCVCVCICICSYTR